MKPLPKSWDSLLRERTTQEESIIKLVAALAALISKVDQMEDVGWLDIKEYRAAHEVLKEVTGFQGPWHGVDVRALRRLK